MNILQACEEMKEMFRAAWETNSPAVVGGDAPKVLWEGNEADTPPAKEFAYARYKILHRDGGQNSLTGATGSTKWKRTGFIAIQCFGPLVSNKGLPIARSLGNIAREAYEGKASPGGIWFRNPTVREVGPTDGWFQVNAIVEFTYDEVK